MRVFTHNQKLNIVWQYGQCAEHQESGKLKRVLIQITLDVIPLLQIDDAIASYMRLLGLHGLHIDLLGSHGEAPTRISPSLFFDYP